MLRLWVTNFSITSLRFWNSVPELGCPVHRWSRRRCSSNLHLCRWSRECHGHRRVFRLYWCPHRGTQSTSSHISKLCIQWAGNFGWYCHVSTPWFGKLKDNDLVFRNFCNELMQLGARGVSILYSSGDIGVAGARLGTECTDFVPTFPNTCPYITSVRTSVATLLQTGSLVLISVLDRLVQQGASIQKKVLIFQQEDSQTSSLFPSTRNQLLHLTWRDLGQTTPVCSTQYAFCNGWWNLGLIKLSDWARFSWRCGSRTKLHLRPWW